jgi:nitrogenase molybdenum-iron protein alpha/beta subunit
MNLSRTEGCTLTGALSVSTAVSDGITIIHGPDGCSHHNVSLLHALWYEQDMNTFPRIFSSSLGESEIVFGGEDRLEQVLLAAQASRPGVIFVLTSCVAAAIGDDVRAVCNHPGDVPVVVIPTGGFLGGGFSRGVTEALVSLAVLGEKTATNGSVNLIGEKNLEFEVEANFSEMARLLGLLGVTINLRFVRNVSVGAIASLGSASLNILREPELVEVGQTLQDRFGTPFLSSFPAGFGATLDFLEQAAEYLCINSSSAVEAERRYQEQVTELFADMRGAHLALDRYPEGSHRVLEELQDRFDILFSNKGTVIRFPEPLPVGTAGMSRMLHRWRRACRA